MVTFIDAHRGTYGVEPICEVLPIAPATYFRQKTEQAHPARRSARAQRRSGFSSSSESLQVSHARW